MLSPFPARAAACVLVLAAPSLAWAADENPNLFSGTIWQSVASIIAFTILLAVLGKYAWGPIITALQDRENKIRDDIETAEQRAAEATATLEQYQQQLAEARKESQRILDQARDDARRLAAQLKAECDADLNLMKDKAHQEIEQAKEQALADVYTQTATLATDVAARILQRELNAEDQKSLVEASLSEYRASRN